MSDYAEIIDIQTMMCKLLENGKVIAEYKVERCDRCAKLAKFDRFGFQKSHSQENLIWFCSECR